MIDKPTAPTHDVNNVAYQIQAPPTGRIKISIIIVINFMKKGDSNVTQLFRAKIKRSSAAYKILQ